MPSTYTLAAAALSRLKSGFRPATLAAYTRMLRDFLAFLQVAKISLHQVNTVLFLAYMEFLVRNGLSPTNVANNVAGIRALLIMYGSDTSYLKDERVALFLKSLRINQPFNPTLATIITVPMLEQILLISDHMKHPLIYKALYLFMFFSFLRLSNVLPHSAKSFDITRHLTRGDLIFSDSACTVLIKWSKTLQNRKEIKTIAIPSLENSILCPVAALKNMFLAFPAARNDPLFVVPAAKSDVPLADSAARKHLKAVSVTLNVIPHLTFHDFRKSGTTFAFQAGVPLQDIMDHGTWSSDTVWRYIKAVPATNSAVSRAFQASLS